MTDPKTSATLDVVDTCATKGPRVHEMLNADGSIARYAFADHLTAVKVPPGHAMRFAAIDGFKVYDEHGVPVQLRPVESVSGSSGGLVLRADEVVARLDELSKEALLVRAKRLSGGDSLHPVKTTRDELIAFVLAGGARPDGEAGDDLVDEPDDDGDA